MISTEKWRTMLIMFIKEVCTGCRGGKSYNFYQRNTNSSRYSNDSFLITNEISPSNILHSDKNFKDKDLALAP